MKSLKKIIIFTLWIAPALVFGHAHLSKSGIKGTFQAYPLIQNRIISVSTSSEAVFVRSSVSTDTANLLKSDKLDNLFNDLRRWFPVIKIETEILRYNLSFENNVLLKLKYSEQSTDSGLKEKTFQSLLSCEGKQLPFAQKVIMEGNLYLGNGTGDNREYIEKIISDCLENLSVSLQNNTGKNIYLPSTTPEVQGTITFLIQPDSISIIFIFIAWFVAWSGFLILLREGVLKSMG